MRRTWVPKDLLRCSNPGNYENNQIALGIGGYSPSPLHEDIPSLFVYYTAKVNQYLMVQKGDESWEYSRFVTPRFLRLLASYAVDILRTNMIADDMLDLGAACFLEYRASTDIFVLTVRKCPFLLAPPMLEELRLGIHALLTPHRELPWLTSPTAVTSDI